MIRVLSAGYKLIQFDVVVITEEPKLSSFQREDSQKSFEDNRARKRYDRVEGKNLGKNGFLGNGEGAAALVNSRLNK